MPTVFNPGSRSSLEKYQWDAKRFGSERSSQPSCVATQTKQPRQHRFNHTSAHTQKSSSPTEKSNLHKALLRMSHCADCPGHSRLCFLSYIPFFVVCDLARSHSAPTRHSRPHPDGLTVVICTLFSQSVSQSSGAV